MLHCSPRLEDYLFYWVSFFIDMDIITEMGTDVNEIKAIFKQQTAKIETMEKSNDEKDTRIIFLEKSIKEKDARIKLLEESIDEKNVLIVQNRDTIKHKEESIQQKDAIIENQENCRKL